MLPKFEIMKIKSLKLSHSVYLFCRFSVAYIVSSPIGLFIIIVSFLSLTRYSATGCCFSHCLLHSFGFLIHCLLHFSSVFRAINVRNARLATRDFCFKSRDQYNLFLIVNFSAYLFSFASTYSSVGSMTWQHSICSLKSN